MPLMRFLKDCRGSIAPMFAVAMIPAIGLVGAAIDYSRGSAARAELQSALDATALMISRDKDVGTLTAAQLQTKVTGYFESMFSRPELKGVTVTPVFAQSGSTFTVSLEATGSIDTMFMRVLNATGTDFSKLDIATRSEVTWGIKRLEIALALDNTGSMSSNSKMTELKKASKSLIDTLYSTATKEGDVKIAVIPFATDVNVNGVLDSKFVRWTEWDAQQADNRVCSKTVSGICTQWKVLPRSDWAGCVWDRDQENDASDTEAKVGTASTLFSAHNAANCPTPILPLTDVRASGNWGSTTTAKNNSVLGKKIDAMTPNGNTNVTIGLAWAWHALTASQPLTQAGAVAEDLDKVIILLTDGENTQNRFSSSATQIDKRTQKACDNLKSTNIKVYTVRVINGNADLLRNCATKTDMYKDVQNANEINDVFNTIAKNLASLRISK